ncbi:class I SAM-dependent methyltransferase [Thermosynechococcaceae cyanobacterium Okahandja]
MEILYPELYEALHKVQSEYIHSMGHNDQLFLKRIYRERLDKYVARLEAIGFSGHRDVLDAGCGYGQWSLALASINQSVSACDISTHRIEFVNVLCQQLGVNNISTRISSIDKMPYESNRFDAVFCYGVIFMTPWLESLKELARVLKPGGLLYVNANGLGWYIFLWKEEHNKADDYDPRAIVARTFADTLKYNRQGYYELGTHLIIEPEQMRSELQKLGFIDIKIASEGCLHLNKAAPAPKPFLKGVYQDEVGVYEVVATKLI